MKPTKDQQIKNLKAELRVYKAMVKAMTKTIKRLEEANENNRVEMNEKLEYLNEKEEK